MKRPLVGLSTAVAVAVLVLASATMTRAAIGAFTPFSDPAGDVAGGPDITNVGVAHTVDRRIVFSVLVPNNPPLVTGTVLELRLDTDMNPSTGAANGVERLISRLLWTGQTRLCTWNGSSFDCAASPSTTSTYVNGLLTVTTTAAALGVTSGFDFSIAGYKSPDVDFAPDSGTWPYRLGRATPSWPAP